MSCKVFTTTYSYIPSTPCTRCSQSDATMPKIHKSSTRALFFYNRGFPRRGTHLYVHDFSTSPGYLFVQRGIEKNNKLRWNFWFTSWKDLKFYLSVCANFFATQFNLVMRCELDKTQRNILLCFPIPSRAKKKKKEKKTKQNKTKQNKTKQNKTKQNKTKQNKTKQNKTKQNKTKQNKNKTKQNKNKQTNIKHGSCEYDDLQNCFDVTSYENPLLHSA